jgi:GxxExxY protein
MDTNKPATRVDLLFKEEVYAIVGAAMAVHNDLGAGFLEAVYQEAMEMELTEKGVPFARQVPLTIWYRGKQLQKHYVADLVCFDRIVVDLKAITQLTSREQAQMLNYLKATRLRLGVLINFGDPGQLEWERVVR